LCEIVEYLSMVAEKILVAVNTAALAAAAEVVEGLGQSRAAEKMTEQLAVAADIVAAVVAELALAMNGAPRTAVFYVTR
jgi:aspartate/methionine/tyrosine aminotransferase